LSTAAKIHVRSEKVNKNIFVASCHSCEGDLQRMQSIAITHAARRWRISLARCRPRSASLQARAVDTTTINGVRFEDSETTETPTIRPSSCFDEHVRLRDLSL
jgi:hypothetical protein